MRDDLQRPCPCTAHPTEIPLVLDVPAWVYLATIAGFATLLGVDLFISSRNPHAIGIREATYWVLFYVGLAVAFGIGVIVFAGGQYGAEFFAGYVVEY